MNKPAFYLALTLLIVFFNFLKIEPVLSAQHEAFLNRIASSSEENRPEKPVAGERSGDLHVRFRVIDMKQSLSRILGMLNPVVTRVTVEITSVSTADNYPSSASILFNDYLQANSKEVDINTLRRGLLDVVGDAVMGAPEISIKRTAKAFGKAFSSFKKGKEVTGRAHIAGTYIGHGMFEEITFVDLNELFIEKERIF